MKYSWYYDINKLNLKFIDKLVKDCLKEKLVDGRINTNKELSDVRKAKIKFLDENKYSPVYNLVNTLGIDINNKAFGFDINKLETCQFTLYNGNNKSKYDWHIDTNWISDDCFHRKMSVIIQLSDPSDYEGGKVELKDSGFSTQDEENIMQKGAVIAFPSFWEHRVTPVTKGKRMSLIAWFVGAKFR